MTKLQGLIIASVAAVFTLSSAPSQAGMPMMDDPILLSVNGEVSCARVCIKAKSKPQGSAANSQGVSPYKTYRDRLGFGSPGNGASRLRR